MVLVVAYDLHNPGRDYEKVEKILRSADSSFHVQGSVWFLDTQEDCGPWRDRLREAGDANDEFFVAQLRKHWAERGIGSDGIAWLKSGDRTW
jgi:CRISPR/Cas system-associated endoribonuclease Cas2